MFDKKTYELEVRINELERRIDKNGDRFIALSQKLTRLLDYLDLYQTDRPVIMKKPPQTAIEKIEE